MKKVWPTGGAVLLYGSMCEKWKECGDSKLLLITRGKNTTMHTLLSIMFDATGECIAHFEKWISNKIVLSLEKIKQHKNIPLPMGRLPVLTGNLSLLLLYPIPCEHSVQSSEMHLIAHYYAETKCHGFVLMPPFTHVLFLTRVFTQKVPL